MVLARLMEIFAPLSCLGCNKEGDVFCTTCRESKAQKIQPLCYSCGAPSFEGATCPNCKENGSLAGVSVGAHYAGSVRELILQLKFHRLRSAHGAVAALVMRSVPVSMEFDVVTSVPISALRHRERGYNQSELVARLVARELALPYRSLLERASSTHQLGLGRHERLRQVSGAFFASRQLDGQKVLIVDDVVTTGATLAACAGALSQAGASYVWGAVAARH